MPCEQSIKRFGLIALSAVGTFVHAAAGPAPAPVELQCARVTNVTDLAVEWLGVASDIHGNAKAVAGYNVYCSADPLFVPDLASHSNLLASVSGSPFVHSNALSTVTSLFYYVAALGADGSESLVFTDMVYKVSQEIACPPGTNAYSWIAIPYSAPWTNAAMLGRAWGAADRLYHFNETNQAFETWDCLASNGVNFAVAGGDVVCAEVSAPAVLHVYGLHDWARSYDWQRCTNRFNRHWLSVPPNAVYGNAAQLAGSVTGATKVARFDVPSQRYESWFTLGGSWMGDNFPLRAGEGVMVSLSRFGPDTTWQPALPYPKVSVNLSARAAYVDVSPALTVSGAVADAENDVMRYWWDLRGDGTLCSTGLLPAATIMVSFTNADTWYPTLYVKDSRGFVGLDSKRYDALTMSLSFSNQSFRAGLGETGIVSYNSSSGGAFTTWIMDANGTMVRILETNSMHGGAASLFWDGRNSAGQFVSNGLYYVVISNSLDGTAAVYNPAFLQAGTNLTSSLTGISVAQTFNPYAGGQFPIGYTLPGPARVTVWIQDSSFQTLASVCSNVLRSAGEHIEYWDGRLANGSVIGANQSFQVAISAVGVGQNALIVEAGGPSIDNLTASAVKFMPALNPYGNNTNALVLSYQLAVPADVRAVIRRVDGQTVQSALDPGKSAGANQTVWPGTDGGGVLVPEGLYSVTLQTESDGSQGNPSTVWVEVYY